MGSGRGPATLKTFNAEGVSMEHELRESSLEGPASDVRRVEATLACAVPTGGVCVGSVASRRGVAGGAASAGCEADLRLGAPVLEIIEIEAKDSDIKVSIAVRKADCYSMSGQQRQEV